MSVSPNYIVFHFVFLADKRGLYKSKESEKRRRKAETADELLSRLIRLGQVGRAAGPVQGAP